jgi:formimidoylglutamase
MPRRIKWSLLGIADHQGVANVGGRIGAAEGPAAFRAQWAKLNGKHDIKASMQDFGDFEPSSSDIVESHLRAAARVKEAHLGTQFSVVIGGGHDHGSSHLDGIRQASHAGARIGCINIDAHLDVRDPKPVITSGSPFRLAIESGCLDPSRFIEFGIQDHCNKPELWSFVERNKIRVVNLKDLRHGRAPERLRESIEALASQCESIVISLDLDSAAAAFAPGVSAPQAEGFSSSDLIEICEIAGANPMVCSLGIFELNPAHDIDNRTSKLAATLAFHFVDAALNSDSVWESF